MSLNYVGDRLVERLQGTCMSLDAALEEEVLDIDTVPFEVLQYIDEGIAVCSCCEWWMEVGEMDENDCCSCCT